MVAKISVGSSLFGALSYNQNKVDEEQGKVLLSNRMFESEDGNFSIRRCMECFDMHLPADLKTEKPIIHISLNPHPDDESGIFFQQFVKVFHGRTSCGVKIMFFCFSVYPVQAVLSSKKKTDTSCC